MTILFTDIVTFTNIAAAVKPIQIVDMLNAMYKKYDDLTTLHGVYKVNNWGAFQYILMLWHSLDPNSAEATRVVFL